MHNVDFASWQTLFSTLGGLAFMTLVGVGIRLLLMQTVQRRRERENRQINERLKTLIAAYKTLGGSFTGELLVDPKHLRDIRRMQSDAAVAADVSRGDRARRMRDAVEGALADVVLLGTEEHVRLASHAASELVAGRPVETAALVVSLRTFIREALDLEPVPAHLSIPSQGPTLPGNAKSKGAGGRDEARDRGTAGGKAGRGGDGAGGGWAQGLREMVQMMTSSSPTITVTSSVLMHRRGTPLDGRDEHDERSECRWAGSEAACMDDAVSLGRGVDTW